MGAFSHVRLAWALLMTSLLTAMGDEAALSFPATFEVDLLFPHNATYAPSPLMPVVFAVQNPALAKPLVATIRWAMWEGDDQRSPGSIGVGDLTVGLDVDTERQPSDGPLLVSSSVNTAAYPDGFWSLAWSLQYWNCSDFTTGETFSTVFTVSKAGQAPDLVAATSADECGSTDAHALNITGVGCFVLGPSPTTNPCAATIDSAAASSLSAMARATGYACATNSNLTCPTSFPNSAGSLGMTGASTLLTLLAALAAVIHLG
ncbi:hypothetical protein J3F83DRAFT_749684 [Trichoderma novae-zelandiae]